MAKVRLSGKFANWTVDEESGKIWDDGGNDYDISEIRALFYFRQWQADFEGWNGRIRSLKEHLEKKIERTVTPTVIIEWGDVQERLIHPWYR